MRGEATTPEVDEIHDDLRFRSMPDEIQQRILTARQEDRERFAELEETQRRVRRGVFVQAVVLFTAFYVLGNGISWVSLVLAPIVGFGVGAAWWKWRAGILLSPLCAMGAYLLLQIVFPKSELRGLLALVAVFPLGLLSAYLGSRREVASYE